MTDHVQFMVQGLASGGVYAALALALVLTYRSSVTVNLATGAVALYGAYAYAHLRTGELLLLVPPLPATVDLGGALGLWPAMLIAVGSSALLSLLLYAAVFRPLRAASPVARTVASIGVMVVLTGLMAERIGASAVIVEPIFPQDALHVGDVSIGLDRLLFVATVAAVAVALGVLFRRTRFGLATRAAAESERGALVSGLAPDRIAAANWAISGAITGLAGVLIAPLVPLVPISYTLFIVPALAAALLARFSLIGVAVVAGIAVGVLRAEATFLSTEVSWLPSAGLPELLTLALIGAVLLVRGDALPTRGQLARRALGRAPRPAHVLAPGLSAAAVAAVAVVALQGDWRAGLLTSLVFGVIALSLVVVTGLAGQISLAQLTLAGAAGFLLGPLGGSLGIPFPFAPLLAAVAASVIGVVVGLPALRVRGLSVAVVTLALAVTLESGWFRNSDLVEGAGVQIDQPSLLGLDLAVGTGGAYPRLGFSLLALAVLVAVGFGVAGLRRSRLGAAMLAVRANERSAAAAGVDVVRTKIAAFAIGAFIAGIGGSLYAYQLSTVTFDAFDVFTGLGLFATVYLAGITSVSGGVLAGLLAANGLVFVALEKWVGLGGWFDVVVGVGLVATIVLNPDGLLGPVHARLARRRERATAAAPDGARPARDLTRLAADAVDVAAAGASASLEVRGLTVRYGGVTALDDVSFRVAPGRIVGLIGPNGAGKTTLIDALSGFAPAAGEVLLDAVRLDGRPPHRRIRSGLGRTFQAVELYDDLTVRENVLVGLEAHRGRGDGGVVDDVVLAEVLVLLSIEELADRVAGSLSQGQRQLVSIARALAGRPRVLVLDEPAGGLDTDEGRWLGERLRRLRAAGLTILMVEHDMGLVMELCDDVVVLDFGRVIATGPPTAVVEDPAVAEAYLGTTMREPEAAR